METRTRSSTRMQKAGGIAALYIAVAYLAGDSVLPRPRELPQRSRPGSEGHPAPRQLPQHGSDASVLV